MRSLTLLLLVALSSCQIGTPPPPPSPATLALPKATPAANPLRIVWRSVERGSKDVALNAELRIRFSRALDPATATEKAFRVKATTTQTDVEVKVHLQGAEITLAPVQKFFVDKASVETKWKGLKPDTGYEVQVLDTLRDRDGNSLLSEDARWGFRTSEVDYGLYWFDQDGTFEKPARGSLPKFFDPTKPVLLYLHGWQNGTTSHDVFREHPFIYAFPAIGEGNSLIKWRDSGWNVVAFYWNQWADEPEVKDAQAKVWKGGNTVPTLGKVPSQLRYRLRNGEFRNSPENKSVAEILLEEVKAHLSSYRGPGVRIVAHSLGSQLGAAYLDLLDKEVHANRLDGALYPKRLAMLDPFWSKGQFSYLNKRTPAEVCTEIVRHGVEKHGLVVEQVKSSALGGTFAGDENLPMREITAFHRIWPNFIPLHNQAERHIWAYIWYLETLSKPGRAADGSLIGAAATDDEIRKRMNFEKKEKFFYDANGKGNTTKDLGDDSFERKSGVSTW